jgi:hypothetical protein
MKNKIPYLDEAVAFSVRSGRTPGMRPVIIKSSSMVRRVRFHPSPRNCRASDAQDSLSGRPAIFPKPEGVVIVDVDGDEQPFFGSATPL